MFNILQWNPNSLLDKADELKILINKFSPLIICIQESRLKPTDKIPIKFFQKYRLDITSDNTPIHGVAILAHHSLTSELIQIISPLQVLAILVKSPYLNHSLCICTIYIPPLTHINTSDLVNLVAQLPKPFIITGDFNSHHPLWGNNYTNSLGAMIEQFLFTRQDLVLLNNGKHTHFSTAYKTFSAIDLSIAYNTIASKIQWHVLDDPCRSDHFPILISLDNSNDFNPPAHSSNIVWIYKRANWSTFKETISFHKDTVDYASPSFNIDTLYNSICSNILDSASKAIPQYNRKKRPVVWFSAEIQKYINKRKKALKDFHKYGSTDKFIEYKKWRAKVRFLIKEKKRESWIKFVETINQPLNSSLMYKQIKKIHGKNIHKPISSIINTSGQEVLSPIDIANTLATHYASNSSCNNSPEFLLHKSQAEKVPYFFRDEENNQNYNLPFTLDEFNASLISIKSTAVGTDSVSYQMIKNLPFEAQTYIINLFNHIWINHKYPIEWSKTIIIPIHKKDKPDKNPSSYRPISLINCFCKVFERIVNRRLTWLVEQHNLLSPYQSGCRKNRSTIDNLVHLEHEVTESFRLKKYTIAVVLDIKSAYDSTWRRRILNKLCDWNIGGHLFRYIEFFLNNNKIKVKVNSHYYSSYFDITSGIRQGSSLSCVLFNIALSDIHNYLPVNIKFNLYMDDLIIFSSHKDINILQRSIQDSLDALTTWSNQSGFSFSSEKTVCMIFHRLRISHHPPLTLNNEYIQYKESHKWLGLFIDSKLNWNTHILFLNNKLKSSCNILKMLNNPSWGVNRNILIKIFNTYCRPITDYGSIVYHATKPHIISKLNSTHNSIIRLCTGAFRSSPLESLFCESGIPNLQLRTNILTTNYITKLASNSKHMLHHTLIQTFQDPIPEYSNKPKPLFIRYRENNQLTFDINNIIKIPIIKEPWLNITLSFDRLIDCNKDNLSPLEIQSHFHQYIAKFKDHIHCFVDGSKSANNTGGAYTIGDEHYSFKLNPICSVFSAELIAIHQCLLKIELLSQTITKVLLFSDSLSALKSLQNYNSSDPICGNILKTLNKLYLSNCQISFCWIPSHKGIKGNELADQLAKNSNSAEILPILNHKDIKISYKKSVYNSWDTKWKLFPPNQFKLREIKDSIVPWNSSNRKSHKEEVVLTRLRIGHSFLTHSFLMNKCDPALCSFCSLTTLTIKHLLIECTSNTIRILKHKYNFGDSLQEALGDNDNNINNVLLFLKATKLYDLI